jgi:hypothetical protein
MPMTIAEYTTKGGRKVMRTYSEGKVGAAEADQYKRVFGKGGTHYGWSTLSITAKNTEMDQEARKVFSVSDDMDPTAFSAIVLQSTVMRVTVGFLLKFRPSNQAKICANETEAEAWLDQVLATKNHGPA